MNHEVFEVWLDDESDAANPITEGGGPLDERVNHYMRKQEQLVEKAQVYINEVGAVAMLEALKERGVLVEKDPFEELYDD